MAKRSRVRQPQIVNDVPVPTNPRLYWPRCDTNNSNGNLNISRHEKFPFKNLYEVAKSLTAYPANPLPDMQFLNELVCSKLVIIIQKSFTKEHYEAVTNFMKQYERTGALRTERLVIISKKPLGADCIKSREGALHVMQDSSLFRHNNCDFHDRIVILDGRIWHFGATVCGMHRSPHAYSGPWEDVDSSFLDFIRKTVRL